MIKPSMAMLMIQFTGPPTWLLTLRGWYCANASPYALPRLLRRPRLVNVAEKCPAGLALRQTESDTSE